MTSRLRHPHARPCHRCRCRTCAGGVAEEERELRLLLVPRDPRVLAGAALDGSRGFRGEKLGEEDAGLVGILAASDVGDVEVRQRGQFVPVANLEAQIAQAEIGDRIVA